MKAKTLHLNLKKKWFELILSGEKKEEYREIKEYWTGRFVAFLWVKTINSKSHCELLLSGDYDKIDWLLDCDTITFSNGYAKDRRQFEIEFKGIEIAKGKPEWGAENGKLYFVIKLGKIINTKNF